MEWLRNWTRQAPIDAGERDGLTTAEREDLSRLRRENLILCEEREIPNKAAAFFAKETGRIRWRRFCLWSVRRPIMQ